MDDPPSRTGTQRAVLQQRFLEQLPSRLRDIEERVRAGRAEPGALRHWRDLSVAAQALNGAAKTHAMFAVAAASSLIEAICQQLSRGGDFGSLANGLVSALDELRVAVEAVAAPSMAAPASAPAATQAAGQRLVYILEGDDGDGDALAEQLAPYGYAARVFGTDAALRAALDGEAPLAIIAELALPPGGGTPALPRGSESSAGPRGAAAPAVVVISERGDLAARIAAVRAGAEAYIMKPLVIGELVSTLDRLTGAQTPAPFRVLIVDDEAFSAAYHAAILESAGMITAVLNDPLDALAQLTNFDADLLLLDMYMPRFTGTELAAAIRQYPAFASLPIVYLSSEKDIDKQLDAIAVGADDFLVKPVVPDRLISSVSARARRLRLLRGLVTQDPMTQLLNHGAFKERLAIELSRAARTRTGLVVGVIDIDFFKRVNDTYGHPTGDTVIKSLARLLKQRLRQDDVVARYGGEEFGIVLPDTDLASAKLLLDGLRESFAELAQGAGKDGFHVTLSCGLAAFPALSDPAALVEAADQALYAAKQGGRNQVRTAG